VIWVRRLSCLHTRRPFCGIVSQPVSCKASNLDRRRRTLLWKSRTRSWIEMNDLLGNFVERSLPQLSDAQADLLEQLLARNDAELFGWVSGQSAVPKELLENEVLVMLLKYINRDHPALSY
ncbi:unnamed protein product, partial [Polarella glacialis]